MVDLNKDYSLFIKFIETFSPTGFVGIDAHHPMIIELEQAMEINKQFFVIADSIQMKFLYTSKGSTQIIGTNPSELSPYHFFEATHPDDIKRHNLGRTKLFKMGQDIFTAGKGNGLASSNYRIRNAKGGYTNLLFQCYVFYSSLPYKTSYIFQVNTNVDWCKKLKFGYHYYIGNDMSFFRYPDEELMIHGNILTAREFEIIKLIETGLNSDQVADKLFLSKHTISTHRSNILKKTNKMYIAELIYELKEMGLL